MSLEQKFENLNLDVFEPTSQDTFETVKPMKSHDKFETVKPMKSHDKFKIIKPTKSHDKFETIKPTKSQDTFETIKPMKSQDTFKEQLKEVFEQELSLTEIIKRLNNNDTRELTSIIIGPKINEDQNYYECSLKKEDIDSDDLENPYKNPYMEDGPFVKPLDGTNGLCVFLPCNKKVKTPEFKTHFKCMCKTHQTEVNKRYGFTLN